MLRAGNWRFLVGGQEFDCEPAIMRRVYTRGLLSYREGVGSMPRIGVSHWDLADALLRRRAPHFQRGVGDKRYSKWHTVHTRVRIQPMHAPWPNLEGPARRAGLRAMSLSMRRWGVVLKILALRRKK